MPPLVVGFDLDMTLIDSRPGVIATFDALNARIGTAIDGVAIAGVQQAKIEQAIGWIGF